MFRFTRAYSVASLIGILLVAIALGAFYRHTAVAAMIRHQTEANVALSRTFANSLWPRHRDFIRGASRLRPEALPLHPDIAALRRDVLDKIQGLRVVKIKIYDAQGLTVFSTEAQQIGEHKGDNAGFRAALRGETASEFVYRDHFSAVDQLVEHRHLLSSYIPIREKEDAAVEAVFEVYSDVTPLMQEIRRTGFTVFGVVLGLMLLLYLFLLALVRRAERKLAELESAERKAQQERVWHLAYHDPLTGLANRALFIDRLNQAMGRARRENRLLGIVYIDMDRFKVINDSLGHHAGDAVLIETAKRIRGVLREVDTPCRIGGDEFVVILEGMNRAEEAGEVAERLLEALVAPMQVEGREFVVSASLGIAVYPGPSQRPERLLEDADAAMRKAKNTGRNRYAFYSADMDASASEELDFEMQLRRAVENNELVVLYQPRFRNNGQVVAVEALLRWNHPTLGMIPPGRFVPVLEDTGLIVQVGAWVLLRACTHCVEWRRTHPALRVSVNVSARQFRSESFVETVRETLRSTGLPAEALELEITESMLVDDTREAAAVLEALKALGVILLIDDFGTGYSSLAYLRHFPIDYLKIDRSFIDEIESNQDDRAITGAIAALAKNLRLRVVAEGIENEAQARFVKMIGCDEMQGYLFSEPLSPPLLAQFLAACASVHAPTADEADRARGAPPHSLNFAPD